MRIGVDIGGVIIGGAGPSDTSFFSDRYLDTPMLPGAISVVTWMAQRHEVFIISKAGPNTVKKSWSWLRNQKFFVTTGVSEDNVIFCRERSHKAAIASLLELDVMIDDRQEICDQMEAVGVQPIVFSNWLQAGREVFDLAGKTEATLSGGAYVQGLDG